MHNDIEDKHSCDECGGVATFKSKGCDDENYPIFDSFWCENHKKYDSVLLKEID